MVKLNYRTVLAESFQYHVRMYVVGMLLYRKITSSDNSPKSAENTGTFKMANFVCIECYISCYSRVDALVNAPPYISVIVQSFAYWA